MIERPAARDALDAPPAWLRANLLATDLGFLAYWTVSALGLLPAEWLFADHDHPILVAWNWSFAPIDLLASTSGLLALSVARRGSASWRSLALVSVVLTFCAGAMAVSFWALRRDFDPAWWAPNIYLVVWSAIAVRALIPRSPPFRE